MLSRGRRGTGGQPDGGGVVRRRGEKVRGLAPGQRTGRGRLVAVSSAGRGGDLEMTLTEGIEEPRGCRAERRV